MENASASASAKAVQTTTASNSNSLAKEAGVDISALQQLESLCEKCEIETQKSELMAVEGITTITTTTTTTTCSNMLAEAAKAQTFARHVHGMRRALKAMTMETETTGTGGLQEENVEKAAKVEFASHTIPKIVFRYMFCSVLLSHMIFLFLCGFRWFKC